MDDQPVRGPSSSKGQGQDIVERQIANNSAQISAPPVQYRVYKRRFLGLIQLVLLNIIVSWDWLTFSAVSTTSAEFFRVSETSINWLSTGYLFAFVGACPATIWALNRGPKTSIVIASILTLAGNWIRYAGARATGGHFGVVVLGQVIIGFAQPFVLTAPTRYSDLWFSDQGRVSATAVTTLANPLGGALGQLIGPMWASTASQIPNMVLYTSILSTVASLPSFFLPSAPPTPPSSSAAHPKLRFRAAIHALASNTTFYILAITFSIYVGFFNAFSSLINQVLSPYSFSETEAGIAGALLIFIGLAFAAIVSPILDRTKKYLLTIKILVPLIALGYLILVWAPQTRSAAAVYASCAVVGAASFALLPCALEYLVEITHPVSPEVSSTVCWAGGQLLGAVLVIIMGALKEADGEPKGNMKRALVFQAVLACAVVPLPLALGWVGTGRTGLGRVGDGRAEGVRVERTADAGPSGTYHDV